MQTPIWKILMTLTTCFNSISIFLCISDYYWAPTASASSGYQASANILIWTSLTFRYRRSRWYAGRFLFRLLAFGGSAFSCFLSRVEFLGFGQLVLLIPSASASSHSCKCSTQKWPLHPSWLCYHWICSQCCEAIHQTQPDGASVCASAFYSLECLFNQSSTDSQIPYSSSTPRLGTIHQNSDLSDLCSFHRANSADSSVTIHWGILSYPCWNSSMASLLLSCYALWRF